MSGVKEAYRLLWRITPAGISLFPRGFHFINEKKREIRIQFQIGFAGNRGGEPGDIEFFLGSERIDGIQRQIFSGQREDVVLTGPPGLGIC